MPRVYIIGLSLQDRQRLEALVARGENWRERQRTQIYFLRLFKQFYSPPPAFSIDRKSFPSEILLPLLKERVGVRFHAEAKQKADVRYTRLSKNMFLIIYFIALDLDASTHFSIALQSL